MNRKYVFQKHKILPPPHLRSVYRAIKSESCIVIKAKAHVQYICWTVLCCWCSHHFMYSTVCESVNAGNTSFTPLQRSNLYPSLPVPDISISEQMGWAGMSSGRSFFRRTSSWYEVKKEQGVIGADFMCLSWAGRSVVCLIRVYLLLLCYSFYVSK